MSRRPIPTPVGTRYARLTVIEFVGRDPYGHAQWKCRCDCGREIVAASQKIKAGVRKSCGCEGAEKKRLTEALQRLVLPKFPSVRPIMPLNALARKIADAWDAFEAARDAHWAARRVVELVDTGTSPPRRGFGLAYKYGGPSDWVFRTRAECLAEQEARRVTYEAARKAYRAAATDYDGYRSEREFHREIIDLRRAGRIHEIQRMYAGRRIQEMRDPYIRRLLGTKTRDVPPVLIEAKRAELKLKRLMRKGLTI